MAQNSSEDTYIVSSIHLSLPKKVKTSRPWHCSLHKITPSATSASLGRDRKCRRKHRSKSRNTSKRSLHYLKPGALAQLRDAQRNASRIACFTNGNSKKRLAEARHGHQDASLVVRQALLTMEEGSRDMSHHAPVQGFIDLSLGSRMFGPLCPQRKKLLAPRTYLVPQVTTPIAPFTTVVTLGTPVMGSPPPAEICGGSLLESLPLDLLSRIVCNLQHNQLKPAFHVCKRLRQAVLIARESHFDFTTPDREWKDTLRKAMSRVDPHPPSSRPYAATSFSSRPPMPRALQQALRSPRASVPCTDMQQLAGLLSQGFGSQRLCRVKPVSVPRSSAHRGVASHRVLFFEDDLCQAVAQNAL